MPWPVKPPTARAPGKTFAAGRGGAVCQLSDRETGRASVPRILAPMLGAFDRYSVLQIGIAAAVVGLILLIGWWQGPPRP